MAIIAGLIGGVIIAGLGALAMRLRKPASAYPAGWKYLRPGWHLHFMLLACAGFVVAVTYFFIAGGSTRPDAYEENLSSLMVGLSSGAVGLWFLWAAYLCETAWKDSEILVDGLWRKKRRYHYSDIVDIEESCGGLELKLRMQDGSSLRVNVYFHGFQDFLHDLFEHLHGIEMAR
jgi:hypothetical protein